ncbi:MAG: hypothetical protein ACI9VR_003108 [Cognaticolwellia sp.]|jgi:hypothetical protein
MEILMKRFLLVAALIPTLVACSVPEEDFAEAYGETICKQLSKCQQADYEATYEDNDCEDPRDCVPTRDICVDIWGDIGDLILFGGNLLGQDYSEENATDCLTEIRRASCEEFEDADYECEVFE